MITEFKIFENYTQFDDETELEEFDGIDLEELKERSMQFIKWRRMTIKIPDGAKHIPIAKIKKIVVRNNGTIYIICIPWETENGQTYYYEVFDENVYYKFIQDPGLYIATTKYNL